MIYSNKVINKAIHLHRLHFEQLMENAGFSGSYSDGGYSTQMQLVNVFTTVWNREDLDEYKIPEFLSKFLKEALIEVEKQELKNNPEFIEYQKLHSKFKKYV